ncbi:unnamed protein product [Cochlearia groenlandica]
MVSTNVRDLTRVPVPETIELRIIRKYESRYRSIVYKSSSSPMNCGSFGFQIDYDTRYLYEGQVVRISNFEVGRQLRRLARGQAAQEFYAGYDPHQDDEFVFVALLFWRVFYFGNDFVEIRSCAGGFSTVRFNPDYPKFDDLMTRYR